MVRRRQRVEPTEEWNQLELLLRWPEQREYELLRPVVVFGGSVAERARETGVVSEQTLRRNADHFDECGMPSLFGAEPAKYQRLPPAMGRLIVDRKAEYPAFSLGEIARIYYVTFGRRPSKHTVTRVIEEDPTPLMPVRRYPYYHEIVRVRANACILLANDPPKLSSGYSPSANEYDGGGMIHDREHYKGWERYISAERRDLRARREGLLRRMLGMALPEERPEELERLAREDQRRAERGLVELQGGGQTWYKALEELTLDDLPDRAKAEMARARWLRRRQERMKKMIRGD